MLFILNNLRKASIFSKRLPCGGWHFMAAAVARRGLRAQSKQSGLFTFHFHINTKAIHILNNLKKAQHILTKPPCCSNGFDGCGISDTKGVARATLIARPIHLSLSHYLSRSR